REVDVARQRREVACLDGHILRQGAAAIRVREAEHPLSHRQPRRAIAEGGDHSGQLLPGDRRCSVTVEAIGPGRGPRQLTRGESRGMNLNDDVVYRCLRLGPLHQLPPGRSRSLVRHHARLHDKFLLGYLPPCWICSSDKKPVGHLMPGAMGSFRNRRWKSSFPSLTVTSAPFSSLGKKLGADIDGSILPAWPREFRACGCRALWQIDLRP